MRQSSALFDRAGGPTRSTTARYDKKVRFVHRWPSDVLPVLTFLPASSAANGRRQPAVASDMAGFVPGASEFGHDRGPRLPDIRHQWPTIMKLSPARPGRDGSPR
jgi:hypothetical protein